MMGASHTGRRNELARQRGFVNYYQQRKYRRDITTRADLGALPPGAQERRQLALDAVAKARREDTTIEAAAFPFLEPQAVAYWAPGAVTRSGGQLRPTTADRLYRPMYLYSNGARHDIDVRGSKAASMVGRYHSAIGRYVSTGDMSGLQALSGVRVGGFELETDPDVIDQLARRGMFDFESIYRMVD